MYEKYGLEFTLKKLNGMFAIYILDLNKNQIFWQEIDLELSLFIIFLMKIFSFSSEIKSFLAINNFKFKLNKKHISEYFIFKYLAPPNTLISEINLMLPGELIVFEMNQIKKKIYFDFQNYSEKIDYNNNKSEILKEKLKISVKSQLMSDVNIGCQLSGGINSSLVTLFAKNYTEKLDTFSVLLKKNYLKKFIKKVTDDYNIKNTL